jgi:rod shape determining protein RodA
MLGFAALFSASNDVPGRVVNQLVSLSVALVAMWIVAQIPPQTLMRFAVPAYFVGLGFLVAVALFGDVVNGARRWLHVGVTRFQPSEMMKLALPLMLAWYFHRRESTLRCATSRSPPVLLVIPFGLIVRQPDLGTAALVGAVGFYVIFFAGISWKVLAASPRWASPRCFRCGACSTTINVSAYLRFSTRRRTLSARLPHHPVDHRGGLRRLSGKGWLNGTQAHLEFIPERHTDFIFAVYSEEFGLIGNLVLLVLYALLIGRGLVIAANAATVFARLMAGAVTLMFFTYAFVNMGMVSGILPVVGRAAAVPVVWRHRAAHAVHRRRHPHERAAPPQARADLMKAARRAACARPSAAAQPARSPSPGRNRRRPRESRKKADTARPAEPTQPHIRPAAAAERPPQERETSQGT